MKNIQDQYKTLKKSYSDKISPHIKTKLDKYYSIIKQMHKFQLFKPNDDKNNDKCIDYYIKKQISKIRRQIENQCKINMTDYQAYIWKLEKNGEKQKPVFFQNLCIGQQKQQNFGDFDREKIRINYNFPIFCYKIKELIAIGAQLLSENKYIAQNFHPTLPLKLLTTISTNYNIQPYHNFTHGFSVFMMLLQCKNNCEIFSKMYTQFQFCIIYIAALCHDLNHNGTNSVYQIMKKSQISILYNNQSVLENMHIATFYSMCKNNSQVDIIGKIKSPVQRQSAKRLFNRLILATDIQGHTKNLQKLQIITKAKKPLAQLLPSQKQLILQNLFHACDIGNPCLQYNLYLNWSLLLSQQFTIQTQLQKSQNLEISANMQYLDMKTHYRRQIGFIDFLVLPIWKEIITIFVNLEQLKIQIQRNRTKLQQAIGNSS